MTGARVTRLEMSAERQITGVVYVDRETGTEHRARGSVVVLAGNAIGTARILLSSANAASSKPGSRSGSTLIPAS